MFLREKQVEQAQKYIQEKFIENYVAELKSTVSEKCFEKCFDPKSSDKPINTSETGCHALCCDRYCACYSPLCMQTAGLVRIVACFSLYAV